ncbi:MAG: Txe/YoeB family addiction module toxin, partial [Clostridia bacterium]|nr:Txe/YoeB family addiction module toxin [Clostridia bacterium]
MLKAWTDDAWEDYLHWQGQDRKTLKRINALLKDIERNPFSGKGKPEPLIGNGEHNFLK